jgi:hypothetical protein
VVGDAIIQGKLNLIGSPDDPSIFIGKNAGTVNEGLNDNIFIGYNAGNANTTGNRNIFLGRDAGISNVWGSNNTFLGFETGARNTTGGSNTFIGSRAGGLNGQGHNNTFLGYLAGHFNGNGIRNTFLGSGAGRGLDNDLLEGSIAIGYNARVNCSNCAIIGGTGTNAVKVGIGTDTPQGALHLLTPGTPPAGLDADENGLLLGVESTTGYKWIQSYGGRLVLNLMGNAVGVGTASVDYTMEVNGSAGKPGGGDWTNSASDRRLKRNIRPYKDGLEKLLKIRPVWYQYNGKTDLPTEAAYVGIIAQEMQDIAPYTVGNFKYEGNEYLNFDGSALRYMIINAVQELHRELEEKEKRIEELEQVARQVRELQLQQEALMQRLAVLEAGIDPQGSDKDTSPSSATITLRNKAVLYPNHPNPFSNKTTVRYYLPATVDDGKVQITNAEGKLLGTLSIKGNGQGEIMVETRDYPAGTYYYSLVVNGEIIDSKPMIKR